MSDPAPESHATQAEKDAQGKYAAEMKAEDDRYQGALTELVEEHEGIVRAISDSYTEALARATGAGSQSDEIPY